MEEFSALKARVSAEVDSIRDDLIALSRQIYDHPEIGFQERQAVELSLIHI